MNIAVCLHGLCRGSTVSAGGAYDCKFKKLRDFISPLNPDVFIHSWDKDISDEINDIFKPELSLYESQKDFQEEYPKYDQSKIKYNYMNGAGQGNLFKTLSFLYSRKKSIELKNKVSKSYDAVLISRFDVGYHNDGKNKTSYLPKEFPYSQTDKINQAYWDQTDAGASDHWFITNSKNADYLGDLYDKLPEYLASDSEYTKCCNQGWPLSCATDEFSGQIFKVKKSDNLFKYRNDNSILVNNHCLYKWHIMQDNKWNVENCKFWNQEMWRNSTTHVPGFYI